MIPIVRFTWGLGSNGEICNDPLRTETGAATYTHQSHMMVLGVTEHIWSVEEMAVYQTKAGH